MDIHELEVLVAVAEEKSFSRAAKLLHRTQPAISQAVSRLEKEIDEKLFDRSTKDGTLTYAGEVLLEYARQMLNTRKAATTAIREIGELQHGKVTISANEHTVFYLLPVISEFKKRHPLIKIHIQRGVASRIPKEIMDREVELGVISFKPEDKSVESYSVKTDELVMIVSPRHRLAKSKNVSISDLGLESFIAHNAPSPYRDQVIAKFRECKTTLNIGIEMPSLEAIKRLVEQGDGVAFVPRLTAESEISAGRLTGLSVKEMKLQRQIHIICKRNGVLSKAAREFLNLANNAPKWVTEN